jgi:transcriptional regulator with XRE-family HTH domain
MAVYTSVGKLLLALRGALDMTQPQAAGRAGVAVSTWSRAETDHLVPGPDKLAAMAAAVGATPGQLEKLGENLAADKLRTRQGLAADLRDRGNAGDSPFAAIVEVTRILVGAGWSVTTRQSDQPDTILMELRLPAAARTNPVTKSTAATG